MSLPVRLKVSNQFCTDSPSLSYSILPMFPSLLGAVLVAKQNSYLRAVDRESP